MKFTTYIFAAGLAASTALATAADASSSGLSIGDVLKDDIRVNSRQDAKVSATFEGHDADGNCQFNVKYTAINYYREKGDTFGFEVLFLDADGNPLFKAEEELGVNMRGPFKRGPEKNSRTRSLTLQAGYCDTIAAVDGSAHNDVNTRRVEGVILSFAEKNFLKVLGGVVLKTVGL